MIQVSITSQTRGLTPPGDLGQGQVACLFPASVFPRAAGEALALADTVLGGAALASFQQVDRRDGWLRTAPRPASVFLLAVDPETLSPHIRSYQAA